MVKETLFALWLFYPEFTTCDVFFGTEQHYGNRWVMLFSADELATKGPTCDIMKDTFSKLMKIDSKTKLECFEKGIVPKIEEENSDFLFK